MKSPKSPSTRESITWRQLCAIVREQITTDPDDLASWHARIVDRILALGFHLPASVHLSRAMANHEHLWPPPLPVPRPRPITPRPDPTIVPRTPESIRGGAMWTPLRDLLDPKTSSVCGCSKPISGARPLRCTREVGHVGDHGLHRGGVMFVRWSREDDER